MCIRDSYFCLLFNISANLRGECAIGTAWIVICYVFNTWSRKGGGYFQNISTVIKLIPLLTIACLLYTSRCV